MNKVLRCQTKNKTLLLSTKNGTKNKKKSHKSSLYMIYAFFFFTKFSEAIHDEIRIDCSNWQKIHSVQFVNWINQLTERNQLKKTIHSLLGSTY